MKLKYTSLIFALLIAIPSFVFAATTPSATLTPKITGDTKQIEDLKERLATKVAQLSQTEKRAISGTVKSVSLASITVETKTKDLKIELNDGIKVFQFLKGKRTELTADDISKGDSVVIFGEFDSTLDLMKAKVIFIAGFSETRLVGTVTSTDTKEFTISLATVDNQNILIDFERTTKAYEWALGGNLAKSGFSKIVKGLPITVLGTMVPKVDNRLSASRILIVTHESQTPNPTSTSSANLNNSATLTPTSVSKTSKTSTSPTSTPAQ
jgi:hypothetical protein